MNYKYIKDRETGSNDTSAIQRINDDKTESTIPFDPANIDYQEYIKWKAIDGNEPEEAD